MILDEHLRKVMIGYFNLTQHFYLQPIQFIVLMNSQNRFTIYQPIETEMFHELSWRSLEAEVIQNDYDGYLLYSGSMSKIKILSILMQCKDGSYIHEQSWCDIKEDCFDGSDEQECYCSEMLQNTNVICPYRCTDESDQCSCSEIYFTCLSSFKCIPYSKLCDGHSDCLQGEDKYCGTVMTKLHTNTSYSLSIKNFTCVDSNTSIPLDLVGDLVPDCPDSFVDEKRYYNFLTSTKQDFSLFCFKNDEIPCIPGYSICFPISKMCVYDFKYNSYHLKYCRNGTHLFNCTNFQCLGYFKCLSSYWIPFSLICDGKWDCSLGHDELNCHSFNCSSLFKCQNQTKCLHLSDVCNKNRDCLLGDDELSCDHNLLFICPTECKCFAQGAICHNLDIYSTTDIWITVKYFKCYNCHIQFHNLFFRSFDSVLILSVKKFQSPYICINSDRSSANFLGLKHLDMSFNNLTLLTNFCLVSLKSLIILNLHKNSISTVEEKSFLSLLILQLLDLSCNEVTELKGLLFDSLENIKILNLTINPILFVSADPFRNIPKNTVHSFNTKICCMSRPWTKCKVENDADSSCDSLLSQKFMKYLCWTVGVAAIFLNIISISVHIQMKKVNMQMNSVSMLPLAVVDRLYGIYLTSIAIVDLYFGDNYVGQEIIWRSSFMCKISSFLALVSMLSSPVIIGLMMMARYCIIRFAMTSKFLKQTFIRNCILINLTVSVTFCVLVSSTFGFFEK